MSCIRKTLSGKRLVLVNFFVQKISEDLLHMSFFGLVFFVVVVWAFLPKILVFPYLVSE